MARLADVTVVIVSLLSSSTSAVKAIAFSLLTFIVLLGTGSAQQSDPAAGILPFSTRSGGSIDSVDLATGSVLISVPIRNKPGKMPFAASLFGNNHIYMQPILDYPYEAWESEVGLLQTAGHFAVGLTNKLHGGTCEAGTFYTYDYMVVDELATSHPLPTFTAREACGGSVPTPKATTDGSGYTVTWNSDWTVEIYDASGVSVSFNRTTDTTTVTDPDGVTMQAVINSNGGVTYTDTLGTVALFTSGFGSSSTYAYYSYYDFKGNTQTFTVQYSPFTLVSTFGCSNVSDFGPFSNFMLPTSLTLPNGGMYTFSYESVSGGTTGRVATITYPDGGYASYSYSGGNSGDLPPAFVHVRIRQLSVTPSPV